MGRDLRADGVAVARVTKAATAAQAEAAEAEAPTVDPEAADPAPVVQEEVAPAEPEAVDPEPVAQAEEPRYVPGLHVRTLQPSRRRAGLEFGPAWRAVPLSELAEEQIEALLSDSLLMVETAEIPVSGS